MLNFKVSNGFIYQFPFLCDSSQLVIAIIWSINCQQTGFSSDEFYLPFWELTSPTYGRGKVIFLATFKGDMLVFWRVYSKIWQICSQDPWTLALHLLSSLPQRTLSSTLIARNAAMSALGALGAWYKAMSLLEAGASLLFFWGGEDGAEDLTAVIYSSFFFYFRLDSRWKTRHFCWTGSLRISH